MRADTTFGGDDLRRIDPKFQPPRFAQYLSAVRQLDLLARDRFLRRVIHLAIRWMFEQGIGVALWGGRRPDQIHAALGISGWSLDAASLAKINHILGETIKDPIGPEFMAPPPRS
jgi:aryl-alcohol dehydrogenase-like predicted oxidoreductase